MNSENKLMIEGEVTSKDQLRKITREFLTNNGKDKNSSDNPQKAIVSIKADRGSEYNEYLTVLDDVKYVYFDLRAASVGLNYRQYLKILDTKRLDRTAEQQALYDRAKKNFPLRIAEATI